MKSKLIWAVDPFARDLGVQQASLRSLIQLDPRGDEMIEPVCVLSPHQLSVPESAFKSFHKEYRIEADIALGRWIERLGNPRISTPTLLVEERMSVTGAVDTLLEYAAKTRASAIGLGTTTRGRVERYFVGSFAETAALRSETPLLITNPHARAQMNFEKVLFATDFSDSSREAFQRLLAQSAPQARTIVLFHKFDFLPPVPMEALMGEAYQRYIDDTVALRRQTGGEWEALARRAGVNAECVVDVQPLPVVDAILGATHKARAGLIALGSSSGRVAAALLGSIARETIRRAEVPVWVMHPRKEK